MTEIDKIIMDDYIKTLDKYVSIIKDRQRKITYYEYAFPYECRKDFSQMVFSIILGFLCLKKLVVVNCDLENYYNLNISDDTEITYYFKDNINIEEIKTLDNCKEFRSIFDLQFEGWCK